MPRTVTCQILDEPDGRFSVAAVLAPDRIHRREGLATRAEAEDWIEGLRVLMAACGAPVVLAEGSLDDRGPDGQGAAPRPRAPGPDARGPDAEPPRGGHRPPLRSPIA